MLSKNSSLKQSFTSGGLLVVLGLLPLQTNFSYAQSYHGSLRGTLTDGSGKALADATLTLVNEQTNVSRVTVTNEAGEYVEITPAADGLLELLQAGGGPRQGKLVAYRPEVARAKRATHARFPGVSLSSPQNRKQAYEIECPARARGEILGWHAP